MIIGLLGTLICLGILEAISPILMWAVIGVAVIATIVIVVYEFF